MPMKLSLLVMLFSGTSLITGCTGLNAKFDCPLTPGVLCESLDQVNTQVEQGVLGRPAAPPPCKTCGTRAAVAVNNAPHAGSADTNLALNPAIPMRISDKVLRIWLAPYEDKNGNYYAASVVYTVVTPGAWIGPPVKARSAEGEPA